MKTVIYLCTLCCSLFVNAQENEVEINKTPKTITNFVKKHFPNTPIAKVTQEETKFGTEYNVTLGNKMELDFDHQNILEDIESNTKQEIPMSIIPKNVWDYTKANYLKQQIVGWEKENNKQRIDLSNGTVLEFNDKGVFLNSSK